MKLRVCTRRELSHAWALFETEFDETELLPRLTVRRALLKGDMELLAMFDEESRIDVGFALVGCRGLYGYVWLKYLAVLPWYREHGLGIEFMRLLHRRYADRQGVVTELTDFGGDESTLRALRKFFARFGYVEIEAGARFGGVKDRVLVKPIRGTAELEPVIGRVLTDFYSRASSPLTRQGVPDFD